MSPACGITSPAHGVPGAQPEENPRVGTSHPQCDPQRGCSPSTGAAPGTPAGLQGKTNRQKGKCAYCIPAPLPPCGVMLSLARHSLQIAPTWSHAGLARAAPRADSLLRANGNKLQRRAQIHVVLKGHSVKRNVDPTQAGADGLVLALQRVEGAQAAAPIVGLHLCGTPTLTDRPPTAGVLLPWGALGKFWDTGP